MPYIDQEQRDRLDPLVYLLARALRAECPEGRDLAGPLNYAITRLLLDTLPENPRYSRLALITGVLETVKLEFYRRTAVPYETRKAEEHGDVYNCPHDREVPCLYKGGTFTICPDCGLEVNDGSEGE